MEIKKENNPFHNDEMVTVTIEDIGSSGEGIGKVDGYTLFIKGAVIGDTVTAEIVNAKKSYGFAQLVHLEKPSPWRVSPSCRLSGTCGGCQIQELSYDKQLEYKQKKIKEDLIRIGWFEEETVKQALHPIIGMDNPYRFRNKEQLPVGEKKVQGENGKEKTIPVAGFYAEKTHCIIPTKDCVIGDARNAALVETILSYMEKYSIPAYDETTGKGLVRHILIRTGYYSKEIMVCLIVNGPKLPREKELVQSLRKEKDVVGICLNTNEEKTNVILGNKTRILWGKRSIEDALQILDVQDSSGRTRFVKTGQFVRFSISPRSFYQVNPQQTEKLYSIVRRFAKLTGTQTVWDLYCGVGTISCFLADKAKTVYGIEVIPEAVRNAKENARKNGLSNVTFETGKVEEVLPRYLEEEKAKNHPHPVDIIIVDPPRKGCDTACLSTILQARPQNVIYVSCDPATLSRDLKVLSEGGYRLEEVQGVDQFPHSVHVETVVSMSREVPLS